MTIGSQMPELDRGEDFFALPPYKIGSQNTPYKLELNGILYGVQFLYSIIT